MEKNTNVKEKATSLANGAGKMAQPQVDDWILSPTSLSRYTKFILKLYDFKTQNLKLLEENVVETFNIQA